MSDFSVLKPYIDLWGHSSASERLQKRVDTDLVGQQDFYNATSPYLDAIIEYLNQFSIDEIPKKDKPLAYMALALCEVDDAIHIWKVANLDYISDPITWRTKSTFGDYQ